MKRLIEIFNCLNPSIVSNEKYYKVNELKECLISLSDQLIEVHEFTLIPYFILGGRRMELYEYELNIVDKQQEFEKYLLMVTGKQNINEISEDIKVRLKKCYIECEQNIKVIKVSDLLDYLEYLLSDESIKHYIMNRFNFYNKNNIYFEIY